MAGIHSRTKRWFTLKVNIVWCKNDFYHFGIVNCLDVDHKCNGRTDGWTYERHNCR